MTYTLKQTRDNTYIMQGDKVAATIDGASPELVALHKANDELIHKHMAAIEAGEYTFEQITDLLVELQNNCRAALQKAAALEGVV